MSFQSQLKSDLAVFLNGDEFAYEVEYILNTTSTLLTVQFFDDESDVADTMVRKIVADYDDIPTISRSGYFVIDGDKYGVLDFRLDEEQLIMQIVLQKETV